MSKTSTALRAVPRENLERMTLNLRRRARNEKLALDRFMGRVVAVGSAAAGATAMGSIVGARMRDGKSVKLWGGDMELWYGGIAAFIGAIIQSKTKKTGPRIFGEAVEGAGVGAIAYWAGSRAEAKAAAKAPTQQIPSMPAAA